MADGDSNVLTESLLSYRQKYKECMIITKLCKGYNLEPMHLTKIMYIKQRFNMLFIKKQLQEFSPSLFVCCCQRETCFLLSSYMMI